MSVELDPIIAQKLEDFRRRRRNFGRVGRRRRRVRHAAGCICRKASEREGAGWGCLCPSACVDAERSRRVDATTTKRIAGGVCVQLPRGAASLRGARSNSRRFF